MKLFHRNERKSTDCDLKIPGKYRGTKLAARVGYKTLIETGSVLDAVEDAVRSMELSSDFNAGYGSVLTRLKLSS